MNPKNTRKSSSKATAKKKVKNVTKSELPSSDETKSKFYVTREGSVNEPTVIEDSQVPANDSKKLERSNSFFLTRKLSKIYTKLSGSKENLGDKTNDKENPQKSEVTPFRFQRSLTLNSIQLKKNYRTPFHETRLENLSEEKIENDSKAKSPPMSPPVAIRSQSPAVFRQSMPPISYDEVDQNFLKLPPPLERSGSFISLIRRKISFSDSKPTPIGTSNWATSLQSLQQIDNMVSYEDLSFVDYDKFNQYEQQIDKMLSRHHNRKSNSPESVHTSVVRRRPKAKTSRLMGDFNSNLDREKNLYRQSIDSNKLRFLSNINSDAHRWSQVYNNDPIDWLSLENKPQPFVSNL